nr:MAG TPA: hypothetical protein [Caudoviricetes sp.]
MFYEIISSVTFSGSLTASNERLPETVNIVD